LFFCDFSKHFIKTRIKAFFNVIKLINFLVRRGTQALMQGSKGRINQGCCPQSWKIMSQKRERRRGFPLSFLRGFMGRSGKLARCNPDHNETRLDILPAFSTIPLPSLRFTGKPAR
jgi:hypothetical protein